MDKYKDYMNNPEYEFVPYDNKQQFGNGGVQYTNGGNGQISGEVEKEENSIAPDGTFTQFSGPSHNSGGIKTDLQPGERIFSDRLKLGKKTFAFLNKVNNTNKEDKILEDTKSSKTSKLSAILMKSAKSKASDALFKAQEELKQSKVLNYAKKIGIDLDSTKHANGGYQPLDNPYHHLKYMPMYPDGGFNVPKQPMYNQGMIPDSNFAGTDTKGFPIDARGRRLTTEEQMGFNRPSITQGNFSDSNVTRPQLSLMSPNLGMQTGSTTPIDPYGRPLSTQGQYVQQPTNMTTAQFIAQYQKANGGVQKYPNGGDFNWKDALYNAGMTGANSMGQLAYLSDQGKKYDKQENYTYNPQQLDPTASLRDADQASKAAAYDLADRSGGNAGNYLTNRVQLAGFSSLNKDKIRREYANQNAQIMNQGQQFNIQNKYMTDQINAQNKGQALTNYYKTLGSVGTNVAQGGRDFKSTEMDNLSLQQMKDMFSNYSYDKNTNSWKFKK